ncbi:hypothetical protein MNBD_GAMMA12-1779 [hydrothermal vent metagenome]|uniref:Uncharacterized protein n=1 Tax=hydrothermal vent metagenome TaxID=652676 RepID=A0A3B0YCC3_9ZZZZ
MTYTVFIYDDSTAISQKSFTNIHDAFKYMGELDLNKDVKRCILDNGVKILFDLKRDDDGWLSS